MKKIFTRLLGITLGLAMAIGAGIGIVANKQAKPVHASYSGASPYSISLVSGGGGGEGTVRWEQATESLANSPSDGVTWTPSVTWAGDASWTNNNSHVQIGAGSGKYASSVTLTTSDIPGTIQSVAVMCASYQGKHTVNVSVGGVAYTMDNAVTPSWNSTSVDTARTGTGSSSGAIQVSFAGASGARALYVKSITVAFSTGSFGTLNHIKITTPATKTNYEVGETFSSSGLILTGYDGENEAEANTAVYSSGFTTDFDDHTFVEGDIGAQTVTVTYSGKTATYSINVAAGPNFVHTYTSNSVFNETEADTEHTRTFTPTNGPEYITLGGYNNSYGDGFLSFTNSAGMYLGNNEEYTVNTVKKYISKIVIEASSNISSNLTMTEGPSVLSTETEVEPALSNSNKTITYTFSGTNAFFKLTKTTSSFVNIIRIKIYLGNTVVESVISSVSASIKNGTYDSLSTLSASDFNVTVHWTGGKADTNPSSGFTWTVNGVENGVLHGGNNSVVVTYQGESSDPFNVEATSVGSMIERDLTTRTNLVYDYTNSSGTADGLNKAFIGISKTAYDSGNSYELWSDKAGASGAVYAGRTTGGNNSVQLNSSSPNGIVMTATSSAGYNVTKITIKWNPANQNNRTIDIYGKNTAYTSAEDLYSGDANTLGTLAGSLVYNSPSDANQCESLVIEGPYKYIGIKSHSGAIYLDSVSVQWGNPTYTYPCAGIRFGGFISRTLWEGLDSEENIESYGVLLAVSDLGGETIKQKYEAAKNEHTIDEAFATLTDVNNQIVKKYAHSKDALMPAEANAAQKGELVGDYYVWSLGKYVTGHLKDEYTAVAYIRTSSRVVFFNQQTFSAKSIANDYLANRGYGIGEAEGSLLNLANLA